MTLFAATIRGRSKLAVVLTAVSAAAVLSGCCRFRRTYPVPPARDLLAAVRSYNKAFKGLRARVVADQFTSKGRVKLTVFLLAAAGGRLRMEATVMDNTVAVFVSDGRMFGSLDLKKHVAYSGPARPCNVARLFGIPLEPDQVALVLAGGVPILRHERAWVSWDKCRGREVLRLENRKLGLRQDIWLKRVSGTWRVEGAKVSRIGGKWLVRVSYRDFTHIKGVGPVPRWIRYRQRTPSTDVLLKFKKLERKVSLPDEAFDLPLPRGYEVRYLTCPETKSLPFEPVGGRRPRAEPREQGLRAVEISGPGIGPEVERLGPEPRPPAGGEGSEGARPAGPRAQPRPRSGQGGD